MELSRPGYCHGRCLRNVRASFTPGSSFLCYVEGTLPMMGPRMRALVRRLPTIWILLLVKAVYATTVTVNSTPSSIEEYEANLSIVQDASPGDTVIFPPGEYQGFPENIPRGVTLIGSGIGKSLVNGVHGGLLLKIRAPDIVVAGFEFRSLRSDTHVKFGLVGPTIVIENASPTLARNYIGNDPFAIEIRGDSSPLIRENVIGGLSGKAIRLVDCTATVDARYNLFSGGWWAAPPPEGIDPTKEPDFNNFPI